MKLNVTRRVFFAILAANAIIVLCMFLIMQWTIDRGFLKYVNQQEQGRMNRLAEKLERAYSVWGGWEHLQKTPDAIPGLISETVAEYSAQSTPVATVGNKRGIAPQPEAPIQIRHHRLERRIVVLDAKHNPVFGVSNPADIENFKPIHDQGKVVGYLGLLPSTFLTDTHQLRFVKEQKLVFALVAMLMLIVAAAISLPLARRLVRPLRKLAAATGHLSSGQYDIRVSVESDDEFGNLSRDFNALALSLDKNEQARRQFVADISHELRTPLAILGGEIEAIQDGLQDLSYESINSLQVEVFRINRLVEDLYQLALSDVGALAYRKCEVSLTEILRESINRARPQLAEKSLTLNVAMPESAALVFADADRLAQLFDNLLDNSKKYTDPGGRIDILLELDNAGATVNFKDSGPGVIGEDFGKLFDRLYRVEGSRSRSSGGAGLGLAICRNIVEAHEGSIEALQSPLGGSGSGSLWRWRSPMNNSILIVEDEPKLSRLLSKYLRQAGYEPQCLDNGLDVLPQVRQSMPALILLDLMLPGRDGMDICKEIRSFSTVPIIMLTARIERNDRLLGLELGADDYICKPFSLREAVARVKAVLRRSADQQPLVAPSMLQLDEQRFQATLHGHDLGLTVVEFKLLNFLAANPGRIYDRNELMDRIYPDQRIVSDRTIDSHIKNLRKKIFTVSPEAELIHSLYGVGYKFDMQSNHTESLNRG